MVVAIEISAVLLLEGYDFLQEPDGWLLQLHVSTAA